MRSAPVLFSTLLRIDRYGQSDNRNETEEDVPASLRNAAFLYVAFQLPDALLEDEPEAARLMVAEFVRHLGHFVSFPRVFGSSSRFLFKQFSYGGDRRLQAIRCKWPRFTERPLETSMDDFDGGRFDAELSDSSSGFESDGSINH